jgi:hypothetical protein
MSNPLASLKKAKKPPLFLPEMSTPTPTPSKTAYNSNSNSNNNQSLSPINRSLLDSTRENDVQSSLSNLNSGYAKNPSPLTKITPTYLNSGYNSVNGNPWVALNKPLLG